MPKAHIQEWGYALKTGTFLANEVKELGLEIIRSEPTPFLPGYTTWWVKGKRRDLIELDRRTFGEYKSWHRPE